MNNRKSVDRAVTEAERLTQVWGDNPKFSMGDMTLEKLKAETDKLRNLRKSRDELRVQLSKLVDDTKDQLRLIDSLNTRGRSGMKAIFGPDSAQYAQVGGTRQSERKSPATNKQKSLAA
jgi:hypothetical protein